jgi:4-amino-4-deoxy-L-arabinose transferase-like glycosyltransferase
MLEARLLKLESLKSLTRRKPVSVCLVVLLALILRLWGSRFDLPYIHHPDEPMTINVAVQMLQAGDLNPHFFHWGTAYLYLVAAVYVPYYLLGRVLGFVHGVLDLATVKQYVLGVAYISLPAEVWVARLVSVALGVGTVYLVYLVGRALCNHEAGLLGAVLLAVSTAHVIQSHFAVPDVAMIFFFCLSILYAARWVSVGGRSDGLWAGFWGGIAAATKYNAIVLVLLSLGAAQLLRHGRRAWKTPDIAWTGVAAVVGFILGVPATIVATRELGEGLAFTMRHYASGHTGMEGTPLLWYLRFLAGQGLLAPVAIAGIVWGASRRERTTILLGIVTLCYFGLISTYTVRNERTILPLFPLMAALGGMALARARVGLSQVRDQPHPVQRLLVLAVLAVILVPSLIKTVAADWRLARQDTQTMAREWIIGHIPPGARIAGEAYTAVLHAGEHETVYVNSAIDHPRAWYCEQGVEYLMMSDMAHGRLFADPARYPTQVRDYERLKAGLELVHKTRGPFLAYPAFSVYVYRVPCDDYSGGE